MLQCTAGKKDGRGKKERKQAQIPDIFIFRSCRQQIAGSIHWIVAPFCFGGGKASLWNWGVPSQHLQRPLSSVNTSHTPSLLYRKAVWFSHHLWTQILPVTISGAPQRLSCGGMWGGSQTASHRKSRQCSCPSLQLCCCKMGWSPCPQLWPFFAQLHPLPATSWTVELTSWNWSWWLPAFQGNGLLPLRWNYQKWFDLCVVMVCVSDCVFIGHVCGWSWEGLHLGLGYYKWQAGKGQTHELPWWDVPIYGWEIHCTRPLFLTWWSHLYWLGLWLLLPTIVSFIYTLVGSFSICAYAGEKLGTISLVQRHANCLSLTIGAPVFC